MSKLKIAVIIGSTRDTRFGPKPAQWILDLGKRREELEVELIDLRDFDLPFFNEKATNLWMPSEDPKAIAWQKKVGEFDGYIFVVAEYNRSIPAALKNALDQAYKEWVHKPAAYVGYGSVGAARAIEHLRLINIELQMVPVPFGRAHRRIRVLQSHPSHGQSAHIGYRGRDPAIGKGHARPAHLVDAGDKGRSAGDGAGVIFRSMFERTIFLRTLRLSI
jgi:NAD(P)H-dependent FMN reductase